MININLTEPPIIISGFPGVGKSEFAKRSSLKVADSDSSTFDKAFFPDNYIQSIAMAYHHSDVDYILVSSHKLVRDALVAEGLPFHLAYPSHEDQKCDYLERYILRGSPLPFLKLMAESWEDFRIDCERQEGCEHVRMSTKSCLTDMIPYIKRGLGVAR